MDDKKAANILLGLLDKYSLTAEEKEAVKNAIGILGWTALAKSRVKGLVTARKNKVEKACCGK